MDVTEYGMSTDIKVEQSAKTEWSMELSEVAFDMSTDSREEQDWKAELAM